MQLATERLDVNVPSPVKGAEAVALREQRCVMGIRQPMPRCPRELAAALTRA